MGDGSNFFKEVKVATTTLLHFFFSDRIILKKRGFLSLLVVFTKDIV